MLAKISPALVGQVGEQLVKQWLQTNGFLIVASNYKQKVGEIDLIAHDSTRLVFVEVKTRTNNYFPLSEVITHSKQRKIAKTALFFLAQHDYSAYVIRFDVALVENGIVHYITNAFVPYYD